MAGDAALAAGRLRERTALEEKKVNETNKGSSW